MIKWSEFHYCTVLLIISYIEESHIFGYCVFEQFLALTQFVAKYQLNKEESASLWTRNKNAEECIHDSLSNIGTFHHSSNLILWSKTIRICPDWSFVLQVITQRLHHSLNAEVRPIGGQKQNRGRRVSSIRDIRIHFFFMRVLRQNADLFPFVLIKYR